MKVYVRSLHQITSCCFFFKYSTFAAIDTLSIKINDRGCHLWAVGEAALSTDAIVPICKLLSPNHTTTLMYTGLLSLGLKEFCFED